MSKHIAEEEFKEILKHSEEVKKETKAMIEGDPELQKKVAEAKEYVKAHAGDMDAYRKRLAEEDKKILEEIGISDADVAALKAKVAGRKDLADPAEN